VTVEGKIMDYNRLEDDMEKEKLTIQPPYEYVDTLFLRRSVFEDF